MERYFANGKSKETVEWRGANLPAKESFALFDTYRFPPIARFSVSSRRACRHEAARI